MHQREVAKDKAEAIAELSLERLDGVLGGRIEGALAITELDKVIGALPSPWTWSAHFTGGVRVMPFPNLMGLRIPLLMSDTIGNAVVS